MTNALLLLGFLAAVAAAALMGAQFQPGDWYAGLEKPFFNPPNWIFGPVWSVLYVGIAVAGWLVWRHRGGAPLLLLWAAQLVLNLLWSWIFFGLHRPALALVDIGLLLSSIVAFAVLAWPVSRAAAWLFACYGAWVAFAMLLNAAIWRLNPAVS